MMTQAAAYNNKNHVTCQAKSEENLREMHMRFPATGNLSIFMNLMQTGPSTSSRAPCLTLTRN